MWVVSACAPRLAEKVQSHAELVLGQTPWLRRVRRHVFEKVPKLHGRMGDPQEPTSDQ